MPLFCRIFSCLIVMLALLNMGGQSYAAAKYQRTVESYQIPDVTLTNQDGEDVKLSDLINRKQPVLIDFIYATCTTICPILSAGYSHLQRKLGDHSETIKLLSFSIDPEHDRPQVMTEYLQRYQAKPGWDFLTGNRKDIDTVMHAFDAYVSNKMSHYPLTLIKIPGKDQWVRLYGLVGTKALTKEIELLYGPLKIKGKS
jgi:protein SCO1/2